MKYEDNVRRICGDSWRSTQRDERDGGYGVACIMAFVRGVRPNITDIASHLQVAIDEIAPAYNRLSRIGVFTPRFNVKRDELLQRNLADDECQKAWAHIAGIASGFVGV